jgi:outer membrane biosynthesis protein TonB
MTDNERGAYTPQTDGPLRFDARRAPSDSRPLPMTLWISITVLLVLLAGVAYVYRHGVRPAGQAPQVVGAPVGATKAPPLAKEQSADLAAGLQVYKSETNPPSPPQTAPKFVPAPEQPALRPLTTPTPTAAPVPVAPPASAPAPVVATVKTPAKAPTPPAAPAPSDARVASAAFASPASPASAASAASQPSGADGTLVQIGAFSSAALAEKGWNDTARVLPGAMTGKTKQVQMVQADGKTFYRAFVGGFASRADAQAFCASLISAGKKCIVR